MITTLSHIKPLLIFSLALGLFASLGFSNNYHQSVTFEMQIGGSVEGMIKGKLFHKRAPLTVSNFVTLSQKNKKEGSEEKYFDNVIFHRVIPNFMIQTGDPTGTGSGGPGYCFKDEFHEELRHNKAGIISMANAGKDTNGSQFFITHRKTEWLDDKHSVFGEITEGQDLVVNIGNLPKDPKDKPKNKVFIKSITFNLGDWVPLEVPKVKCKN